MRGLRWLAACLVAAAVVVVPTSPALAHGGGGSSDATNFYSVVRQTPDPELSWEVIAGDALLQLRNASNQEVMVLGYQNEPYLRFSPGGGVFENRHSPAAYLNDDRYAQTRVPPSANPQASPRWERVSDGSSHAWHDHRIHWMAKTRPPAVAADPDQAHTVLDWKVPYRLGAQERAVAGTLRWEPPPAWWPWVLGGLVFTTLPVLVGLRSRPRGERWPGLARPAAAVLGAVAAVDLVHLVDDLVAVPASFGENLWAGLYGGFFIAVALACAFLAWRRGGAFFAIGVGVIFLFFMQGVSHLGALTSSQLASELPEAFTRAVVGANLALVVPLGAAAVFGVRRTDEIRVVPVGAEDGEDQDGE